jgi:uncharacterized protein YegL
MRKLPVYLVLDTSGSMSGEPIEQVTNGVQMLVSALRQDPYALETAFLSVIGFSSTASQLVPLTELNAFQPPSLTASGATSFGDALSLVAERAEQEVAKTTADVRGDWKPMVFIMTDGNPTDDWEKGWEKFKQSKWGIIVGCAVNDGDTGVLQKVCGDAVVRLSTSDSGAMAAFFKWVSASISTSSQKIDMGKKEVTGLDELPPPPPEIDIVGL